MLTDCATETAEAWIQRIWK